MLLKLGTKHDNVKAIQAKLGLAVDGVFGPGTAQAVKDWQTAHGLSADGIVGDATWSKLFAVIAARDESGNLFDDDGNPLEIESAGDKPAVGSVNSAAPSLASLD